MSYENKLWCDIPENEKASFLRSGRAWETGIIARSIVEEIAQVYDRVEKAEARIAELEKAPASLIENIPEDELWNLDYTLAKFMIPRLEVFKSNLHIYFTEKFAKKYDKIISEILIGFKLLVDENFIGDPRVVKSFNLLGKHIQKFWT